MGQGELLQHMTESFSVSELRSIAFDLGVDDEMLGGETKGDLARNLIRYLRRRDSLGELVVLCERLRPNVPWGELLGPPVSEPGPPSSPVITVLFLAADPTDAARLRLSAEVREIQEKLRLAHLRDLFRLEMRPALRVADLTQALLDTRPRIVHFAGHGTPGGEICLEDATGRSKPVSTESLVALFREFAASVECIVFNTCHATHQAAAVSQHIRSVVGMSRAIDDRAAIAFAVGFYQAVGAGRGYDEAVRLGRAQIQLEGLPDHTAPELYREGRLVSAV
jgi:hypothetical protein